MNTIWVPELPDGEGPKYLALTRALRDAIREGVLPDHFGKTHAVHMSPHIASNTQSMLCGALVNFSRLCLDAELPE